MLYVFWYEKKFLTWTETVVLNLAFFGRLVLVSGKNTVRSPLNTQLFFRVPNMSEMCPKLFWDLSRGFETFL